MLSSTSRPASRRVLSALCAAALVVAGIAATLVAAPAAVAEDGDAATAATIGVATRPAGSDGRPDGRTRFSYSSDPGQSVADQVLVGNTGTERQDFTVYATDAFNGQDGTFSLLPTADVPTSVGAWVRFDNGTDRIQFSLEPNEVRLLPFTMEVPADATPGDHVGGLVASVIEEGQQVSLDRRVATSIFARVSGDLQPQLSITSYSAAYEGDWWNPFGGSIRMRYTVTNPGNVALAANITTGVRTWLGIPATGDRGGSIPVLLPGNTASYDFTVDGVGQWFYLNPGTTLNPFVESQDATLQLPVTAVSRDTVVFATPWTVLILIVLIVGVVLLVRWRRRRDEARAQEWVEYMQRAAAEEAEQSADLHGAAR
ncbi:MAG: hypothetical protein BGO45_13335 [Microbacterium sp. 71-36]|uniref:hypothetical protein n=1 Tax=unclassified Microbacterium TaxID=2609290 RepID=UPI0008687889|nr:MULTISPECIES: hypothetical protein [unclassified Microbacterium]MBN9213002.1 hypothetical protein [Microbacterium sp.]ODT36254.1 MAG: hypothetical protein ABS60_16300 [Microbacterium sp. SCN 71-17]OJV77713.1 MAG: hypothetical protein BGO45_13335 [Microbacterium sp. 71-36]